MLEAVWQGVVELGHGAVQAVQRDGWQQQQRRSARGGSEEQEKLRSRADAGRAAMEGELPPAPARSLHHSARPVKKRTLEERELFRHKLAQFEGWAAPAVRAVFS